MYELAKNKGLSDPDTIQVSQRIDRKMVIFQARNRAKYSIMF
jgi:hypothetical protein